MDRLLAERNQAPMEFIGRRAIHTIAVGAPKYHAAEEAKLMQDFDDAML